MKHNKNKTYKQMKQLKFLSLLLAIATMACVTSCKKDEDIPKAMNAADVNPALLVGTWKSEKPFYSNKPNSYNYKTYTTEAAPEVLDGSYEYGSDWTIGETVENQEGTEFYYKVEGNILREQHPDMSIYVPRVYTLMTLTASRLQYFDQYHEVYSFNKQ